jgi:uncharacterized lipoprotein YajG
LRNARTTILCSLAALALLSGCSKQDSQRFATVLDPTPELGTLNAREDDVINTTTGVFDTNWRAFRSDVGRLFLTDRPSRLTPEPVR